MPFQVVFLLVDRLGDDFDRFGEWLLGVVRVGAGDETDVVADAEHRKFLAENILGLEIILRPTFDRRDKADQLFAWQLGDVAEFVIDLGTRAARAGTAGAGAAPGGVAAIGARRFTFVTGVCLLRLGVARSHAADDLLGAGLRGIRIDFVLDRLFELEGRELGIDRRAVKKEIGPASSGLDKAETFVGIERAYFSILHKV